MKNKLNNLIIILCLAVIVGCLIYLIPKLMDYYEAERDFSSIKKQERDLEALWKKNHDLAGWITIKGTRIDYPVMWTPDEPERYLRKNFNKEYSIAGTPFLDAYSEPGNTRNYLVYGHNIKAGTMFHDLVKFDSDKFYKKHKYISFETLEEGKAKYEIVAAFKTEIYNFKFYYYADIESVETYDEYVEKIKSLNELSTDVKLDFRKDQLLTLCTCSYHVPRPNGRMLVVAKKIDGDKDYNPKWEKIADDEAADKEWEEQHSNNINLE